MAGIYKALSPEWRSSPRALVGIMKTRIYGSRPLGAWLSRHPTLAVLVSLSVIVFECALGIAILLPLPITAPLLVLGALFHAANAVLVGLNTFFWAFVASYPAVLYCSTWLDRVVGPLSGQSS